MNTLLNYFKPKDVVTVPAPSNETIYDSQFYQTVKSQMNATNNYRYDQAQQPNDRNYVLPYYNRSTIYEKNVLNGSVLFSTQQPDGTNKQFNPSSNISPLTGLPMTMTFPNMETTMTIPTNKMDYNPEEPFYARKMDRFLGTRTLNTDTTVPGEIFHPITPQNVNGAPIYSTEALTRTKDGFSEYKSMTSIGPTDKIYVPSVKADVNRVKPRNVDELRIIPKKTFFEGVFGPESTKSGNVIKSEKVAKNNRKNFVNQNPDNLMGYNNTGNYSQSQATKQAKRGNINPVWFGTETKDVQASRTKGIHVEKDNLKSDNLFTYVGNNQNLIQQSTLRNTRQPKIKVEKNLENNYSQTHSNLGSYTTNFNSYGKRNKYVDNPQPIGSIASPVNVFNLDNSKPKLKLRIDNTYNRQLQGSDPYNYVNNFNSTRIKRSQNENYSGFSRTMDIPRISDTFNRNIFR